jgi:peptidoglycan/xylan/chitin deacetylase (PgdA/CDA1 family)
VLPKRARRAGDGISQLLSNTLGEGQFGPNHWHLGRGRRAYNLFKPVLPKLVRRRLRQLHWALSAQRSLLDWPIESRYAAFQWAIMRDVLNKRGTNGTFIHFWPQGHQFAFVLTHDIETAKGQTNVRAVADLEEAYGFRSSFNFVTEAYRLDRDLIHELQMRGFEVGVHGLKHDAKLFSSYDDFMQGAVRINQYLKDLGAVGFRAPLMHRHPEWMQALAIEYDLSFFDTDPHEPIDGGTMSIWPFEIGHFVELPYTLVQDHTLTAILRETTPTIWLEKVDFLEGYCGLALLNSHPDYLADRTGWRVYEDFLEAMRRRPNHYWHALPREVARWWRARRTALTVESLRGAVLAEIWRDGSISSAGGLRIVTSSSPEPQERPTPG